MYFGSAPLSAKDIAAHVIPGAILVALTLWFLDGFAGLIINLLTLGTGVVSLVMWLLAAYVAGIFVQLFSGLFPGEARHGTESQAAAQLLAGNDRSFSAEFKRDVMARAQRLFGAAATGPELYRLCQDYVTQHNAAKRIEALAAFGHLFRGILIAARIGLITSALIAAKHLVLLLLPQFGIIIPVTGFLDYEAVHLVMGALLVVVFGAGIRLLKARLDFCVEESVRDVYTSFFAVTAHLPENDR
ncbi:MAG TPA: hypothetical protein VGL38_04740 [bacterium]|jgi:Na+-transporting methylmalonyl-CoA/oxaloacetate decarboxylase gamma subunit